MLEVDKVAEDHCSRFLTTHFGNDHIRVLGEETLWKFKGLDLTTHHLEGYGNNNTQIVEGAETRLTAIIDMIDGSDLVERNLGNWCSAMIFFKPGKSPKILFSLIHHEDDTIYGADESGTFALPPHARKGGPLLPLKGPQIRRLTRRSTDKKLPQETAQISVCFYGQKWGHFASLPSGLITVLLASWFGPLWRFNLAHLGTLKVKRIEFRSAGA
jgi:hypothetical protein